MAVEDREHQIVCLVLTVSPMKAPSAGLVPPSPPRPAMDPNGISRGWPDKQAQQPADLWHAQRRHLDDHHRPVSHFYLHSEPSGIRAPILTSRRQRQRRGCGVGDRLVP
jgi:hypothetical protein